MATYSFLDNHAAIVGPGGSFSLNSGNSDEGITITQSADLNTMTIGADGEGMHSLHADRSAQVRLRYLKTSPVNALLSAMAAFQRTSGANHGRNTITITNSVSGDVITLQQVAIARIPDITYAKEGAMVEWLFHAIKCDISLGAGIQ